MHRGVRTDEAALVPGLHRLCDADLDPAGDVLCLCLAVRRRDRHRECRRNAGARADVRTGIHVLDALAVPAVRGETTTAGWHGRLGVALRAVRDR